RLLPDDLPGSVARARARNGDSLRRAPVELHVRPSRDRPAAQRPPPAIDDWRQRRAATLLLCVQRRLPHPVFPRTEEPEPNCLVLSPIEGRVPPRAAPVARPHRVAPDKELLGPADRWRQDCVAKILSRVLVRSGLR